MKTYESMGMIIEHPFRFHGDVANVDQAMSPVDCKSYDLWAKQRPFRHKVAQNTYKYLFGAVALGALATVIVQEIFHKKSRSTKSSENIQDLIREEPTNVSEDIGI